MIKSGVYISERYEIIESMGSTGMVDVYKARCHKLNRDVIIRILKKELAHNIYYIRLFQQKAQSAAGILHPNVASVFDVGDYGDVHYVVVELVEGITLRQLLKKRGVISNKDAVGYMQQISRGIENAHKHNIIHGKLTPDSITVSRDGKVKVTGFGVAGIPNEISTLVETADEVSYISPEQVRGKGAEKQSDIYSLGAIFYEMICGQAPFIGDNPVAVSLLHLQGQITPATEINPMIPVNYDRVVQKCLQKIPDKRYYSVSELLSDLNELADNNKKSIMPMITNSDTRIRINDESIYDDSELDRHLNLGRKNKRKIQKEDSEELDSMNSLLERVLACVSIVFAIAFICVIIFFVKKYIFDNPDKDNLLAGTEVLLGSSEPLFGRKAGTAKRSYIITSTPAPIDRSSSKNNESSGEKVDMGYVEGMTIDDAIKLLDTISTDFEIDYSKEEYSDKYDKGRVSKQYPPSDVMVEKDARIELIISAGKTMKEMDDYSGKRSTNTIERLVEKGYTIVELHEFSTEYEAGMIIKTVPAAGELVGEKAEITIYISDGVELKPVPYIIGNNVKKGEKLLKNAGFSIGAVSYEYNDSYEEGIICGQDYADGGSIEPGTAVNYVISNGSAVTEPAEPGKEIMEE